MNEQQRRAYLEAIGIDVWLPRGEVDPEVVVEDELLAEANDVVPDTNKTVPDTNKTVPDTNKTVPDTNKTVPDTNKTVPDTNKTVAVANQTGAAVNHLDWDALRERVSTCTACSLHQGRTQTVFGVGNPNADWMFIGEAPGAEEDRRGEPFVGRSGQLLDQMLAAIGESRDTVFIANIIKCRPPNNRDPRPEEAGACRGFLERQIEIVKPRIIIAVGKICAQNLLGTDSPVGRLRGKRHSFGNVPLVVTYHPAYLLRSPSNKRKSWDDLCLARSIVQELDS